jgi:hypothetical protein
VYTACRGEDRPELLGGDDIYTPLGSGPLCLTRAFPIGHDNWTSWALQGKRCKPARPIVIKGSHCFSNYVSAYSAIAAGVLALDKAHRLWLHGNNINPSISSVGRQQNTRPVVFFHCGDEGFKAV